MNKHRILYIVSYWTYNDPKSFVGALRPYKLNRFFRDRGWTTRLITPESSTGEESVVKEYKWMKTLAARIFPPDYTLFWSIRIVWQYYRRLRSRPGSCFLTSCPPNGLAIAGLLVKALLGNKVVWVLDLRDLWTRHPLYRPPVSKRLADPVIEKWALNKADLILSNTAWDHQHWKSRFPELAPKIHLVTNGFDEILQNRATGNLFVYTGGTTGGAATQWVENLLNSCRALETLDARCDFYGEWDTHMTTAVSVCYQGIIPNEEIPRLLTRYKFGFVYLPPGSESGGRVAQKLYDYLAAGVIPICFRPSEEMVRLFGELDTGIPVFETTPVREFIAKLQNARFNASPAQLNNMKRNVQFDYFYRLLNQIQPL